MLRLSPRGGIAASICGIEETRRQRVKRSIGRVAWCTSGSEIIPMYKVTWFVSALFVFSLPTVAISDEYKWIGQITEDGAALSYAIAESDAIKIDFHCERKTRNIVVNFEHEPKDAIDGMRVTMRLTVRGRDPGVAFDIPASGRRLELDDKFVFQGNTRMSPQLRRILAEGGTLLVAIAGQTEEIPLKGIGVATRQLFAYCP